MLGRARVAEPDATDTGVPRPLRIWTGNVDGTALEGFGLLLLALAALPQAADRGSATEELG